MVHLKKIKLNCPEIKEFPFNIPVVRDLEQLEFISPVTILVGENGTGKSTLLEALAVSIGSIAIGGENIEFDETLKHVRKLADYIQLTWSIKTKKGFFLRAEDFFNFVKRIHNLQEELRGEISKVEKEYQGRSVHALNLAKMPYAGSLIGLKQSYGEGLHVRSHGESFMDLFQARLTPGGLYILDEPETPLSPTRQLALISLIKEMEKKNCQFIIATHSPILMAYPNATIYDLDKFPLQKTRYEDLEHVQLTKSFLNNPDQFLRHL